MALVAYDNSDSSDLDDEENKNTPDVVTKVGVPSISKSAEIAVEEPSLDTGPNLFNLLPQPSKTKPVVVEEDDEFLHKKENVTNVKPKAKITVPSLSDFKDVADRPNVRPKAANGKKSGLLSMLPQPRHAVTISSTKSLIPHVLTKKTDATAKKKDLPTPLKKTKAETKVLVNHYSDESDNDEEVQNDFFSINKPIDLPVEEIPLEIVPTKQVQTNVSDQKERTIQSYFKQDVVQDEMEVQSEYAESCSNATEYSSATSSSGYTNGVQESISSTVLDDEAILKLCGTRGKRKREDIQIVEVNQQEVLDDAREWLRKGLMDDTSTRASASKRRGNEPTSQQRRKHQITYLAHQAKANEAELQNQWANSRMSRRQTQSKYGF